MNGLTLITPTGARPEAFALCERWIYRQTWRGPVQWIVVDDCDPPVECSMGQTVIRPMPRWKPGEKTLGRNLLAAIAHGVRFDKVAFIEDDDYYPRDYLECLAEALEYSDLAGEAPARYYNVATGQYQRLRNFRHASLCQTALHAEMLPVLQRICMREQGFLDIPLWAEISGNLIPSTVVGMKGLPGRPGIGTGHRPPESWPVDDDGSILREWLGGDAVAYRQFQQNLVTNAI